jgi:two-component system response regulator MtrA
MPLVMVVDDDQDLAEMLSIVLNGAGMEVDLVGRGDEVMDIFTANPPDLVLLDVMLPGIDGIEVCKLIREKSMVPIVMLTAKGDTQDVVLGLEAGADDYMVKPFKHQ